MSSRDRLTARLARRLHRHTATRYALVFVFWPPIWVADKLRGINPPASLRAGLDWAAGAVPDGAEAD